MKALVSSALMIVLLAGHVDTSAFAGSDRRADADSNKTRPRNTATRAERSVPKPASEPAAAAKERQAEEAPERAVEEQRFQVNRYVVEGNTVLADEKIENVVSRFTGSAVDMKAIERAKNELEKTYRDAGYPTVLVTVPEQQIEDGVVKLQVVEGRLGSIAVTGNEHYSKYQILEKLPSLKYETVLYEPTFVKELERLNANPDRKVLPVLKPGAEPGLVNLELRVKDRLPVHGKIEGDNKGPITTPRNRLVMELQHTNVFGGDEIFTVGTVQTPTEWGQVQNYSASFVWPFIWPDHLLSVYASRSKSDSVLAGGTVFVGGGNVTISGNATIAGFRLFMPVMKTFPGIHTISAGVDYKRLEETTAQFPSDLGSAVVLSPIQYTPVSVNYTGNLFDDSGVTRLMTTVKGYVAGMIPGGSEENFAGDPQDPNNPGVRKGSTGTFLVIQPTIERIQALPKDFSLLLHLDGQWTTEPLPPAEAYFAGGMDTVRGYDNYEAVGDYAIRGRAELTSPELFKLPIDRIWQRQKSAEWLFRFRAVAFYDAAHLWVADPQPGQLSDFRLEGAGFGIRVKFPKDVGELKLDQGWPLRSTGITQRGDPFVYFSVSLTF